MPTAADRLHRLSGCWIWQGQAEAGNSWALYLGRCAEGLGQGFMSLPGGFGPSAQGLLLHVWILLPRRHLPSLFTDCHTLNPNLIKPSHSGHLLTLPGACSLAELGPVILPLGVDVGTDSIFVYLWTFAWRNCVLLAVRASPSVWHSQEERRWERERSGTGVRGPEFEGQG